MILKGVVGEDDRDRRGRSSRIGSRIDRKDRRST
jgi:hypothetical protein